MSKRAMRRWRALKWGILARFDGYPDFGAYRTLLRQERMRPGEIAKLRRLKTRLLVRECLQNVPYYGDLMRAHGLTPENVDGPEDLQILPLLTKSIIRRETGRMLNRATDPADFAPHTTGGSSGTPLDFFRGHDYDRVANAAANMRSWCRMGWRPGDIMARFWLSHALMPQPRGHLGRARRGLRRWLEPREVVLQAHDTSPDVMSQWVDTLRTLRPAYLYGYGSMLTLFANHLHRQRLSLEGVRGIASTAEALLPRARDLLRETFPGATIIDIYGSREVPGIASECGQGTMHVNTDLVHVEYLPDGQTTGSHRLVLTALDNLVFPFIRYDIGDEGSPLANPCPCGLPFPAMRFGTGRLIDSFITPEGRIIYPGFFEDLMYGIRGVHRYQFLQTSASEIILSVVPCEGFDDTTRARLLVLQQEIHRGFSRGTTLVVRFVETIPPTPSGKHLYLVSRVRNPVLGDEAGPGRLESKPAI
jgi:phenylacetate-CoA ligase